MVGPPCERRCIELVDVLWVLWLVAEATERPELYDFLFVTSGVVLDEDGVEAFKGIIDGEREFGRASTGGGAVAIEAKLWGCVDIRFIRCASVGDIVLAPSPLAWVLCVTGITDTLRDAGVAPFALGDFESVVDTRLFSGCRPLLPPVPVVKFVESLGAGCMERALVVRCALDCLALSLESPPTDSVDDRGPSLACLSALPVNRLGRRFTVLLLL